MKKIRIILTGCALTVILAGCESSGDFAQFANVMGTAAGYSTGENAEALNIIAQQSSIAGEQQRQLEIQQQQQQQQDAYATQQVLGHGAYVFNDSICGQLAIVTCNSGNSCDPQNFSASKYTNIKTAFSGREPLQIWVDTTYATTGWSYTITDQNGGVVKHGSTGDNSWQCWNVEFSDEKNNALPAGNYAFNLFMNHSFRKKIYFRVTDN